MDDRTLVLIWTEDSQIFRAEIANGSLDGINEAVLNKAVGRRIPDNHLFPPWFDGITEFQQPLLPDVYVKKHYDALSTYSGTPDVTELVMAEVKILEIISKSPHPNINKYLGCIRNGDIIGGICLEKCVCTLYDLVHWQREVPPDWAPPFRRDVLITGIEAAIDHLHSLNFVHDDINPSNIMVDAAGNPILIDFDTCVTVGSPSRGGTPGWSTNPDFAAFENDAHGFELVTKFIQGDFQGQDHSAFEKDVDAATDKYILLTLLGQSKNIYYALGTVACELTSPFLVWLYKDFSVVVLRASLRPISEIDPLLGSTYSACQFHN